MRLRSTVYLPFFVFLLSLIMFLQHPAALFPQKSDKSEGVTADSINYFAFDIYKRIGKKKGNIVYSPVSVSAALALAYAGAAGKAEEEFGTIFRIDPSISSPHRSLGKLFKSLETKNENEMLKLAYSLWIEKTLPVKRSYIRMMEDIYGAEPMTADFINEPEKSRLAINGWAEEKTMKKIQNLLGPMAVTENTITVLVNAAYFKGGWFYPGMPETTKKERFWISPGVSKKVPTMHMEGEFFVLRKKTYKAVFMEYSKNAKGMPKEGDNVMIVVVPEKRDGLADMERSLTAEELNGIIRSTQRPPELIDLALPKFKLEGLYVLNDDIEAAGLHETMGKIADFSRMVDYGKTKTRVKITKVIQKTFIDVNETGTEAAAATAVLMEGASGMQNMPSPLAVDRPFMYFLCNKKSGAILFMGRVVDPVY